MEAVDITSNGPEPQTFWVAPLEPLKSQTTLLPSPDQIGIAIIQPSIRCLRTTEDFDEERFIKAIKTATACLAWETPAMAGRIEWEDETQRRLKLVIPDDPRIQLRIKRLPHMDAVKLEAQHWPPHTLQMADLGLHDKPLPGVGTINFGVQANLINGGIILMMHLNHIIIDGSAQVSLEIIYAHHLARAMAGKPPQKSGLMPPEALDKSLAYGTHPARHILDWQDWRLKPKSKMSPGQATAKFYQNMAKLSLTIWHFPRSNLDKLRAKMQDPKQPQLTLATCLSTWFWRRYTRARDLPPDTVTKMLQAAQVRGKVKELHEHYTGSALVYGRAKATAAEVSTLATQELGDRIAKSVAFWTPERIREYWGSLEDCENIGKYEPNVDRDFGPDLEVSNLTNIPFYKIDWGHSIRPGAIRFPGLAFTDGWILIHPRLPTGGLEVQMYATRSVLSNLMRDAEFREFAEYWAASDPKMDVEAAETLASKSRL